MKQKVQTDKAQSAEGLLSQAIVSGDLIFTAGFVHITAEGEMVEGSVKDMFSQVMNNIKETLVVAGSDLSKIIKATIYLTDMNMLGELNKEYVKYFDEPMPAREAVCVEALPLGAKIEISVVAEK